MPSIKEEVDRIQQMPRAERKQYLQDRALRHQTHGDDEDGYALYILWVLASMYGRGQAIEEGIKARGRPRGRPIQRDASTAPQEPR